MAEKKIDPDDGEAYTFDEITAFYKGKYKKKEIQAYWDDEMTTPKRSKRSRAKQAEQNDGAKAKAKASTTPKEKAGKTAQTNVKAQAKTRGRPSPIPVPVEIVKKLADIMLSQEKLNEIASIPELADDVLAWCAAHGVVMYKDPAVKHLSSNVPATLLPSPFDADMYAEALKMMPDFQMMMDKISLDIPWMKSMLESTGKIDVICGRLLGICDKVYGEGRKDPKNDIRLHITRNDFMLDTKSKESGKETFAAKQIEMNMIAASFSTHCQDLTEVHRYVLTKYLNRADPDLTPEVVARMLSEALPSSPNAMRIADALAKAHKAYVRRWAPTGKPRVVLFVASKDEKNELDHRKIEAALFKRHGVAALRRSLASLSSQVATIHSDLDVAKGRTPVSEAQPVPKALIVDGHEVTVAYFREGYWPGHFDPLEECWAAREAIELSEAAKCPSAPAQLAGMKKIQQVLCNNESISRFVMNDARREGLQRTFAQQSDPTDESEAAVAICKAATEKPADWVMKPQVEGSGDLIFDEDIPKTLSTKTKEQLAEFILMERIKPAVTHSAVFNAEDGRRPEVVMRSSVAELGVFGAFVADGEKVLQNKALGHLLRSKGRDTAQGGVFVGNAVVDVPLLLPPDLFWPSIAS